MNAIELSIELNKAVNNSKLTAVMIHAKYLKSSANELRRLHAENEALRTELVLDKESLKAEEADNKLLMDENEALRKDAERYRWLRNNKSKTYSVVDDVITEYTGVFLDSSVDAEMEQTK